MFKLLCVEVRTCLEALCWVLSAVVELCLHEVMRTAKPKTWILGMPGSI